MKPWSRLPTNSLISPRPTSRKYSRTSLSFHIVTFIFSSLTDETIRRNWELYGHPDGRQEVSMGIALPQWIIEGKNNIWVLGMYGIVFGGVLPFLVVRLHIDLSCFHLRDSRFCTFVLVLLTVTYSGSMVVRQPTKNKG